MRCVRAAAACVVLLATGCSVPLDDTASIYAAPGQFDFFKCPDLANRARAASQREAELTALMERAGHDASGAIVNTLVYQDELNTVRAQLQELRKVAGDKRCPPPAPEPTAASLQPVH